jgi:hypothetical protein
MQQLATMLSRYARWLQLGFLVLLLILIGSSTRRSENPPDADGYVQMLSSLTLPYMISGDQNALRQSLDLIIQHSPVLEVSIFNTENRRIVQVVNRSESDRGRNDAQQHSKELVLDQSLLGTLSISMAPVPSTFPWFVFGLGTLALLAGLVALVAKENAAGQSTTTTPSTALRHRHLVAISLTPIFANIKLSHSATAKGPVANLVKIVRQLAPNYGLEFLTVSEETLYLQSHSGAPQHLRQAVVFAWNFCQSLGADKGLPISAYIFAVDLPADPLMSNVELIRNDQFERSTDVLSGNVSGCVAISQGMTTALPADWAWQADSDRQLGLINELPSALCTLWRRQLGRLAEG